MLYVTSASSLPPIPGKSIDPPPKAPPDAVVELDGSESAAGAAVGVGYRALTRFNSARASLLAAGTTYYVFLAMFSLIALAYGLAALIGGERFGAQVTTAVSEAFPGLFGAEGIDAEELRAVGQAASIVGLLAMLYAGSGAMVAAGSSIHLIYGAPKDPRNYLLTRMRMLGMLVILGPLIAFSFIAGTFAVQFGDRIFTAAGLDPPVHELLWSIVGITAALVVDFLIVFIILGHLGGIRPPRRAHLIGAVTGAVVLQLMRIPMALILELAVDKPQYGAAATPIGILLVLYLNSVALYGAAALTAGIAERARPLPADVPVDDTEPDPD